MEEGLGLQPILDGVACLGAVTLPAGRDQVGGNVMAASRLGAEVVQGQLLGVTAVAASMPVSLEDLLFEHALGISRSECFEFKLEVVGAMRFHIPGNRVGSDLDR